MLLPVDLPSIERLCLSPQGTRLAVVSEEPAEVLVVALPSGKTVARYSGLSDRPEMGFRSEAKLVIAHGRQCWLCDLATNGHRELATGLGDSGWLYCCRVSPDGKAVALGGRNLSIVGLTGKARPRSLKLPESGYLDAVYYSPDGRFVAVVIAPTDEDRVMRLVAVMDARTGDNVRVLKFPWDQCHEYPSAFRPDNQVLAVGWRDKVLLYDLYPPKSPLDPEVIFSSDDWTLHRMGWARPTACYSLDGREDVRGVWFSKEGIVLKVLSEKGEAVLMAVDEDQVIQKTPAPAEKPDGFWGPQITAGGRAAARVDDKTVLVWDVPGWGEA
jgi:WD40 repeat protein